MNAPDPDVLANDWAFRPLTRDDFELLKSWLDQPAVSRWWAHDTSPTAIEADFGPSVRGEEPTDVRIAELNQRPVGLIQRYWWHDYPEYRTDVDTGCPDSPIPDHAVSIDYFIGEPDLLGRGAGPTMIDAFATATFADWADARTIIVAVHADNRPSWRALEKASFTIVATLELKPDNPIDDRRHVLARRDRRDD